MSDQAASDLERCKTLLRDLVAFPLVTGLSNLPIVDDGQAILDEIRAYASDVLESEMRRRDPDAGITIRAEAIYPPLGAEADSPAEALIRRLWTDEKPAVVSFGTDGGYFQLAGIPTIVFGPGAMAQMHAIDEYIEIEELDRCLRFLDRLIDWVCEG